MNRACIFLTALLSLAIASPAAATEASTYIHDAEGRLVQVERSGAVNNGLKTEYAHDKVDNRENVKVTEWLNLSPR
jgi:hypothetical protein